MRAVVCSACVVAAVGQGAGTLTKEVHPKLTVWECGQEGCKEQKRTITIDSNWRWTHKKGQPTNCYTGNLWDKSTCADADSCTKNCEIDGADKEYEGTYGIFANSGDLTLKFVTKGPYSTNIGSRTYLLDEDDETYQIFKLKNREVTFDVNVSNLPCGLNGALYFVAMEKDGGMKQYSTNTAGSKYGTGYCDAQCPHDLKWINGEANVIDWKPSETDVNAGTGKYGTCCVELDLWEANSISQAYTMHACTVDEQTRCEGLVCGDTGKHRFEGVCDKNGCDYATYRLENPKFYGPGPGFTIDTTKPFSVTTVFVTDDGTDEGQVVEVRRSYSQNGKKIENPPTVLQGNKHDSITNDFCTDWVHTTKDGTNFLKKGDMEAISTGLENGLVLVMSMWDDHEANMLWLDSTYPVNGTGPGVKRGTCSTDSGDPKDVEQKHPHASVTFSSFRYGTIGSTTAGLNPSGTCVEMPNMDCQGEDLSSDASASPADCCELCKSNPKCRAYTHNKWDGHGAQWCYLKTGCNSPKPKPGSNSGKVSRPPSSVTV